MGIAFLMCALEPPQLQYNHLKLLFCLLDLICPSFIGRRGSMNRPPLALELKQKKYNNHQSQIKINYITDHKRHCSLLYNINYPRPKMSQTFLRQTLIK